MLERYHGVGRRGVAYYTGSRASDNRCMATSAAASGAEVAVQQGTRTAPAEAAPTSSRLPVVAVGGEWMARWWCLVCHNSSRETNETNCELIINLINYILLIIISLIGFFFV